MVSVEIKLNRKFRPEVSESEEAVEVEVTRPSFEISPTKRVPEPEFFEGPSKRSSGQTECERRIPMRRHGATLVAISISAGAARLRLVAKPYTRKRTYVFVAHEY